MFEREEENVGSDIEKLLQLLESDDPSVRKQAVIRLGKIEDPGIEKAIEPLIDISLEGEDPHLRKRANIALKNAQSKKAVEAFLKALKSGDKYKKIKALKALGIMEIKETSDQVAEMLVEDDVELRKQSALTLKLIGPPHLPEELERAIFDEDTKVRQRAAEALGEIDDGAVIDPLIEALEDEEREVRWSAVLSLGERDEKKAVDALIDALAHHDKRVRRHAAWILGEKRVDRATEPLVKIAENTESEQMRQHALTSLGKIGDEDVVDVLIEAALTDEDLGWHAAEALARIGSEKASKKLVNIILTYDNKFTRLHAAWILKEMGDEGTVTTLTGVAMDHKDLEKRKRAIQGLGEIGTGKARSMLRKVIDRVENEEVKEAAEKAFR